MAPLASFAIEYEDGTVFEGDLDRLAGFGALVEQVEARFAIVGWNPFADGLPRGLDGFERLDVEGRVRWWRDVDDALPKSVEPEEEFDFPKAEEGVHDFHGAFAARALERVGAIEKYLAAGISVVSINYRHTSQTQNVKPPVKAPLHDAARALQFVRSKAAEWNIDKVRIGATGGSAGACSSLWLAFHDDMAGPKSSDPIARESTRLWCAAVAGAQTTFDPKQMKEWTPNSKYGGHAFGFKGDPAAKLSQFDEFLAKRDTILPWIAEYSPYALVTSDDPPIYLTFGTPPALGQEQKDPTHTANFGAKLQERCKAKGVDCELSYPGAPDVKHPSIDAYLIEKLKEPAKK